MVGSKHPIRKYFISLVEREMMESGIFSVDSVDRVHMFQRTFHPDSIDKSSTVLGMYFDRLEGDDDQEAKKLLTNLHLLMRADSLSAVRSDFNIEFKNFIEPECSEHKKYLTSFLDEICSVILNSLDKAETCLSMEPDPITDESRLHLGFAKERGERFSPTTSSNRALVLVKKYLEGPGGLAFVVNAPSGAGKTYIMAKAAEIVSLQMQKSMVVRFLGTSSKSSDVQSLLCNLCQQLQVIAMGKDLLISGKEPEPIPTRFDELCQYFIKILQEWSSSPLVLILDAVDQLDDTNSGRSLDWLPLEKFSSQVHVLVSTLPDDNNPEDGHPFRCLWHMQRRLQVPENFVEVGPLIDIADVELLFAHLMKLKGRCATSEQAQAIVNAVMRADNLAQTPLMITMLAHKASRWQSSNTVPKLPVSVRDIVKDFFETLIEILQIFERTEHHGCLVSHMLSYITLAKRGISNTELQEVLSLDDDALADSFVWWVTPERKMPSAPLALLLSELAPFLSRRGQDDGGYVLFW